MVVFIMKSYLFIILATLFMLFYFKMSQVYQRRITQTASENAFL